MGSIPDRRRRAAWLSVAVNLAWVVAKGATALLTGSSAVLAEALHSTTDLVASLVALVSVRTSGKPADPGHPFGHSKVEHVSAVIEGGLIMVAAAAVAWHAVTGVGGEVEQTAIGVVVMAAAALVNFLVAAHIRRVGRETQSPALEADAAHLSADVVTSVGAGVALLAVAITGRRELDAIIAISIATVIAITGARLIAGGVRALIDEALPEHEVAEIRDAINAADAPEVQGYHRLRARRSGAVRHIDLHLAVSPSTTVARAHEITDALEAAIARRLPGADVVIHVEPDTHVPERDAELL